MVHAQLCQVLSPSLRLSSSSEKPGSDPVFFFFFGGGRNFGKFRPEKYDFHLYKGFSMEKKKGPNSPDSEKKEVSRSPDFL